MFEHGTYPPSFGPHNGEREAVLTSRSRAVSNHPPGAGPGRPQRSTRTLWSLVSRKVSDPMTKVPAATMIGYQSPW